MKQRKPFKEKFYSFLEANKEATLITMFSILLIGFFINTYYSYFDTKEKPKTSIEDFNIDAVFSKPSNNVNEVEAFELMMLYEELKDSTNLTQEKLSKINKRIDEIMRKKIDTTDTLIK